MIFLKLSILDQAPISKGQTAAEALQTSIQLAQLGDRLGFYRYWIAEHHDLFGLACSNPSVMLSVIGAKTEQIRIGAGAVLLPYYTPFHVAETYNLLATLYPNRIDIGLGRAPGGSAEVSLALTDNYLAEVGKFPQQVKELQQFLTKSVPQASIFREISPTPIPDVHPAMWLLGTSEKSALLAAELGMSYAFGHFMTSAKGAHIVQTYRDNFIKDAGSESYVIAAVEVVCADTTEEAERIAMSSILWKLNQEKLLSDLSLPSLSDVDTYAFSEAELEKVARMKQKMVIGNPQIVKDKMEVLQDQYKADEWMIITTTSEPSARFRSYELLKKAFI